jgi:integrase
MKIKGLYHMPGSRFYWYRWQENGKRRAVSLKTDDLSEAIKKVSQIQRGEWFARWDRAEKPATPVSQLVEKYLAEAQKRRKKPMRPGTAKRVKNALLQFTQRITDVREITHSSMAEWIDGLEEAGRSADTLYTYASTLKTFVKYLVDYKLLEADVLEFDVPQRGALGRKNWLKKGEVERVIGEAKDDNLRFILYAGFHAGLRRNEICNARVGWFDLDAGKIHVQNDPASGFILKDRENRTLPLTDSFKKFLEGFLKGKAAGAYALRPGKSAEGKWMYRYDFSRRWATHMKRCGVRCTIHDARRSFASNLVSEGESVYIVAGWLGDLVQVVERSYGYLAPSAGNINRLTTKVA